VRRSALSLPLALILVSSSLPAQSTHCEAPAGGTVDPGILERPAVLARDMGRVSQRVTTGSPQAQAFYDQGLAYLHSYVWIEAARSFHQALRADRDCAMAWMGLARAEQGLERDVAARAAIDRARALAPKATDLERRFILLRAAQMDAVAAAGTPEETRRHAGYKEQIEQALAVYPDDAELWILRGNAEEPGAWGRGQRGGVGSIAYYEAALRRAPGHFGADHYLVHSFENVGRHAEAARHGKLYAEAAPGVAHAQHMYAHVLPRLGRWDEARVQLEKADAIEERYALDVGLRPGDDWHHVHNLQLLSFTYLRLGRIDDAERALRRAYATPIRMDTLAWQHASLPEFLLLRGRIDEALEAAEKVEAGPVSARAAGAAVRAEVLLAAGRRAEAEEASRAARRAVEEGRATLKGSDLLYFERFAEPFARLAAAEIALAGPDPAAGERAILELCDAVAADPRFDAWGEGLFRLERVAAAARRLGRPTFAAQVEERMRNIDDDYEPGSRSAPVRTASAGAP
jgi:tetratricopeptide (TPR) repeat protein